MTIEYTEEEALRFDEGVVWSEDPDACMPWDPDHPNRKFRLDNGTEVWPHRFVYAVSHDELPDDARVGHTCGNRRCVNPRHLVLRPHWTPEIRKAASRRYYLRTHPGAGFGRPPRQPLPPPPLPLTPGAPVVITRTLKSAEVRKGQRGVVVARDPSTARVDVKVGERVVPMASYNLRVLPA